jgi:hypothetical protein
MMNSDSKMMEAISGIIKFLAIVGLLTIFGLGVWVGVAVVQIL